MTGFEPAAPGPPDLCATGLRYIPKKQNPLDKMDNGRAKIEFLMEKRKGEEGKCKRVMMNEERCLSTER